MAMGELLVTDWAFYLKVSVHFVWFGAIHKNLRNEIYPLNHILFRLTILCMPRRLFISGYLNPKPESTRYILVIGRRFRVFAKNSLSVVHENRPRHN